MQVTIQSVPDLGLVVRSVRRTSRIRLDDLAATAGVSKQFASDVEHGKPTIRLGLVLKLLSELGVPLTLDIPENVEKEMANQRSKGVRPHAKRKNTTTSRQKQQKA